MVTKVNNRMIDGAAVNIRDFGAVGDGVTDDSPAIQAALTYAESLGRARLVFPVGTYRLNSTVIHQGGGYVVASGYGVKIVANLSSIPTDLDECSMFYLNGGQNTPAMDFEGFESDSEDSFTYFLTSRILYQNKGWDGDPALRQVDEDNYNTNRGKCKLRDIHITNTDSGGVFLSSTPTEAIRVTGKHVRNLSQTAFLYSRNTDDVFFDQCYVDWFGGKAFSTAFVKNVTYGVLRTGNKYSSAQVGFDASSFYFGHFTKKCRATSLIEDGQSDGTYIGATGKVSYYAEDVVINHVHQRANIGMFTQGVQNITYGLVTGHVATKVLYSLYHSTYATMENGSYYLYDCSCTSDEGVRNVDTNSVIDLQFHKGDQGALTTPNQRPGVYLNDVMCNGALSLGNSNVLQGSSVTISGEMKESGVTIVKFDWTYGDSLDDQHVHLHMNFQVEKSDVFPINGAVYAHGRNKKAKFFLEVTGRVPTVANPATSTLVSLNYFDDLELTYTGDWDDLKTPIREVTLGSSVTAHTSVAKYSRSKQDGTSRPSSWIAGVGVTEFYDQNIGKMIYRDHEGDNVWKDALGVAV